MATTQYFEGIGRRKSSSARARLTSGSGTIVCKSRTGADYFPRMGDLDAVVGPLTTTGLADKFDVSIKVEGGGVTGQVGAAKLAVARALLKLGPRAAQARSRAAQGAPKERLPDTRRPREGTQEAWSQARPQGPDLHQALSLRRFAAL